MKLFKFRLWARYVRRVRNTTIENVLREEAAFYTRQTGLKTREKFQVRTLLKPSFSI